MNKTFIPKSTERAWWKARGMEKQRAGEKVLTSQGKKSIERHKIWLFHEGCVYVWEYRSSCVWHTWLKRLLSQASCFTMTSSSVRPLAAPLSPAPSCSLSESSRPMKRCWCVKHLFYPLLWDCSPAEYRRHREASINLWPLVETYFPHTSSLVLSLTLCLHPTSLHTWV